MHSLIDQFLDYVTLERGLSPNTRASYAQDLERFVRFLEARKRSTFNLVSRQDIVEFMLREKQRGLSVNSLCRLFVSIRVLFRYLQQEGLLDVDVTEAMDSPRLVKALPGVLSPREVDKLLTGIPSNGPISMRDRAILETLYATGLRVSELAMLRLDDIHFDAGYLRCIGKGRKERIVPISKPAMEALREYIQNARPTFGAKPGEQRVFLSRLGNGLNRKTIWKMIKTRALRVGITSKISPHTLRHSFASHMLQNGAPLRVIQELLGHADIATTQIYTHIDQGRLKAVHQLFHPRA